MAKTLNQFLEQQAGYLKVKNPDEQKFVDKHVVVKHPDRNGNGDEVFKGGKVKPVDRRKDRHGYNPGEDEKVYEELKGNQHKIDANKNGKVDAHDFKLLRKKKVAEEAEQIDEILDTPEKVADYKAKAEKSFKKNIWKGGEKAHRTTTKRLYGLSHPKVANEEAEQIDELSTPTLQSYRKKARAQGNAIVDKMKMGGGDWSKDQKDTKTLRKRAAGAQASGKQLVKRGESLKTEEAEQIDELSRKTLSSYAKKAVNQSFGKGVAGGAALANSNKDVEAQGKKLVDKAAKRMQGAQKAITKMVAKEEAEQIDELSRKTLGSYAKKAKDQMSRSDTIAGREMGSRYDGQRPSPMERKHNQRADKRYRGLDMAINKLAKEEVEQVDEKINLKKASMGTVVKDFQKSDAPQFKGKSQEKRRVMAIAAKLTAERGGKPLRKEERLADILSDLSESHKNTMLSVFNKLNEDNQKKFLQACSSEEGIERMLDFSISHRGE